MNTEDYLPIAYSRHEYAPLQMLESGDVDVWLNEREDILIKKAKETALECEAGKLASLALAGVAMAMSANPLMWIPGLVGCAGYLYTIFQERQDTGSIKPIPLYRGSVGSLIGAAEGNSLEKQHPYMEQVAYLDAAEKDEVLMIGGMFQGLSGLLASVPPKARFDLYRYAAKQFHLRGGYLPSSEEVKAYVVDAISSERRLALGGIPPALAVQQADSKALTQSVSDVDAITAQPAQSLRQAQEYSIDSFQTTGGAIIKGFGSTDRSTAIVAPSRCGKTTVDYFVLDRCFEKNQQMTVWVWQGKGIEPVHPKIPRSHHYGFTMADYGLEALDNIWEAYTTRQKELEQGKRSFIPCKLVITDWQSIKDLFEVYDPKIFKQVCAKLMTIANNGAALSVTLLLDTQSSNIDDWGLGSASIRDNFDIYALARMAYVDGQPKGDLRALPKLLKNAYLVPDEAERAEMLRQFEFLKQGFDSDEIKTSVILSTVGFCRMGITPSFERKSLQFETVDAVKSKKPQTERIESEREINPSVEDSFKVSDGLGEPLKSVWLYCKRKNQEGQNELPVGKLLSAKLPELKDKTAKQVRQYLGILADKGYGDIVNEGGADSAVGFRVY